MKLSLHSHQISTDFSATPSTQSSTANILFDYEIQQTIGSGNFGKVKLGIYKPTNKKVAIKVLSKEKIKKKNEMRIVKRELDILPSFNHINVVHFSKCLEDAQNIYIIMDYCELGELFDYIVSKSRLNEDESAFFFYQIINGVDYIHSKGVCHRDLKPENLLLTKNKLLKIIDFGLASTSVNQNALGTRCGSPSYASPELLKGRKYNGYKTDVWSCGIILYAMICGYLPFDGRNNDELFKLIIKGDVEYPHFLGEMTKRMLKRMLVVNPDMRISISEIKMDVFYLKGKKIYEEQFGVNTSNNNQAHNQKITLFNNNQYSSNANDSQINSFRKKMPNLNNNYINININTNPNQQNNNNYNKSKGNKNNINSNHIIIQNMKLHNQQKYSPVMTHLLTEPNEPIQTPLNILYGNGRFIYKKDHQINEEILGLHHSVDTNITDNTMIISKNTDINSSNSNNYTNASKKNQVSNTAGPNDMRRSLAQTNDIINRIINGMNHEQKDKGPVVIKFPFQNYLSNGAVKAKSKRRRVNNTLNSISIEDDQKKKSLLRNEILPKLIAHY